MTVSACVSFRDDKDAWVAEIVCLLLPPTPPPPLLGPDEFEFKAELVRPDDGHDRVSGSCCCRAAVADADAEADAADAATAAADGEGPSWVERCLGLCCRWSETRLLWLLPLLPPLEGSVACESGH